MNNNFTVTSNLPSPPKGGWGVWRRGSIWLFLELIVISVVAWVVIDPAVVNLYYRSLPMMYDADQLLYAKTKPKTDADGFADNMTEERQMQFLRQLESMEGVESAYIYNRLNTVIGENSPFYHEVSNEKDTIWITKVPFASNARFFETYGLRPLPGSPSAEELSKIMKQGKPDKAVLTRKAALTLFGTDDVVGRHFQHYGQPDTGRPMEWIDATVMGVVEDFRLSLARDIRAIIFFPYTINHPEAHVVIRLKKGIHPGRFVEEHGQELISKGDTEFCRISKLMTFKDYIKQSELREGNTQEVNRSLMLALFFLVNLSLAIIGTVWLQAKRRTEECGVRRAFGATRPRLLLGFLSEGALMATVAVIIGCIIYLNYAYSGLEYNEGSNITHFGLEHFETMYNTSHYENPADQTWPDRFWPHFLIVSGVVYIIILCTVLIGTAIPAMKIINTRITESLREE